MNRRRAARYIVRGIICFLIFLAVCVIIRPLGLTINEGVSYYVEFSNTLLPYILAFLLIIGFILKAASVVGDRTQLDRYIRLSLWIIAGFMIGILITPHLQFNLLYQIISALLFCFQLILGIILVVFSKRNRADIILITITFLSGLASLIFLLIPYGFMIESQIIFQISIWVIFVRFLKRSRR